MSVRTTADEKRDEAKYHINMAYECLLEVLDPDTWGHNEYDDKYFETIEKTLIKLLKLKRGL